MEMSEIESVPNADPDAESLAQALKKQASPDPGFSRLLEENESPRKPYVEESPTTPAMAKYNAHNLLNGQYPPPDSGAGYLFTIVVLDNESLLF
jgi:hypothetical protein